MTKIINWVCGSFFRTIGRVIAFLVIGCLVAVIIDKSDIKITDLFNLQVNASSFVSLNTGSMKWSTTYNGSYTTMSYQDSRYYTGNASLTSNQRYYFKLDTPKTNLASSYNYIYVNVLFRNLTPDTLTNDASYTTSCEITDTEMQNDGGIYIPDLGNGLYEYLEYKGFECETNVLDGTQELYHTTSGINLTYGSDSTFTQNPCIAVSQSGDNYVFKCPILDYARNLYGFVLRVNTSRASDIRFGISDLLSVELNENQQIIDNQNQNTQQIINNQQAQTNATIENQNQNTQQQIESQQICQEIDKVNATFTNKTLNNQGVLIDADSSNGVTDYINIYGATITVLKVEDRNKYTCFYNVNKDFISCTNSRLFTENQILTAPNNAYYMRSSIQLSTNKPQFKICANGNQALSNTINDTNVSESESEASSFFSSFTIQDHGGLSAIVTAPLQTISNLLSNTCTDLVLPLPYVNENITLPCLSDIYSEHFGAFFTIYQALILALVSYRCLRSLFFDVRGFIDPNDGRIEVLDL